MVVKQKCDFSALVGVWRPLPFHCTGCLTLSARISQKRYAGLIGANYTVPFVGTYADHPLGCWRHYVFDLFIRLSMRVCVVAYMQHVCGCLHA